MADVEGFGFGIDWMVVIRRILRYLTLGLALSVALALVPKNKLGFDEIVAIAISIAAVYAVLDVFAPEFSSGARFGSSFALGSKLVGGI
jgi:hypothetical protein